MAKQDVALKFGNSILRKIDDEFWLEEIKLSKEGDIEITGRFNLTEQLNNVVGTEFITLALTVKGELDSDEYVPKNLRFDDVEEEEDSDESEE